MDLKHKITEEMDPSDIDNPFDRSKIFPTLTSVLSKNCEDIELYDLDVIQDELEHLLHSFQKQYNQMSKNLTNPESENIKESNDANLKMSSFKEKSSEKILEVQTQKQSSSSRPRNRPVKSQDLEFTLKSDIPKPVKNDTSGRFWTFLEPYCADVTLDDIKMLEKWIESHDKDSDYECIPPLGPHYSTVWTETDILEEMVEGSKSVENPKGVDLGHIENISGENLLDRAKNVNSYLNSEQPPLIQKLILSLAQENIIASNDIMTETIPENNSAEVMKEDTKSAFHSLIEDTLKNRLRSHFEKIGVLEKNLFETKEDELLTELKRLQTLVMPVSKLNLQKKKELLARAKNEVEKQESKKRIQETDAKVMESYRIMLAAKSKGKKMNKMECLQIRTMLEDREMLIKSLENVKKSPEMPKMDCYRMDES